MIDVYYFKEDSLENLTRYFYTYSGFYHSVEIEKQFPYRMGNFDEIKENDILYKQLETWARSKGRVNDSSDETFVKSINSAGIFYPRMWRGTFINLNADLLGGTRDVISKSKLAVEVLFDRLIELFKYIEPATDNTEVYGHKVRELLLLSCMEVESSFKAILKTNSYTGDMERLRTNDYIKLLDPLKLDHYEIQLIHFPEIGSVNPFKNWTTDKPTQSLEWYNAYNQTKHNREDNLCYSKLKYAIDSVCAAVIILCAQFGPRVIPSEFYITMKTPPPDWFYVPKLEVYDVKGDTGKNIGMERDIKNIQWEKRLFEFEY